MANAIPRHRTYYEGDDDGSILQALAAGGLLPVDLEVVQKTTAEKTQARKG
jgi:hypothetical protein